MNIWNLSTPLHTRMVEWGIVMSISPEGSSSHGDLHRNPAACASNFHWKLMVTCFGNGPKCKVQTADSVHCPSHPIWGCLVLTHTYLHGWWMLYGWVKQWQSLPVSWPNWMHSSWSIYEKNPQLGDCTMLTVYNIDYPILSHLYFIKVISQCQNWPWSKLPLIFQMLIGFATQKTKHIPHRFPKQLDSGTGFPIGEIKTA